MRRQYGFSYWFVLLGLCLTSLTALKVEQAWQQQANREKEQDLLFIGEQYRHAVASYYFSTQGTVRQHPRSLNELIADPRFPEPKRHLRKLYGDPVNNGKPFEIIKGSQGEIVGVFSMSHEQPLKLSGFSALQSGFEKAKGYRDWKFIFLPPGSDTPAVMNESPSYSGGLNAPITNMQ